MTVTVDGLDMTCKELVELVTDYLDGVMPKQDRRLFEAHLEICPHCVTYLEQMRTTIRVLGKLDEQTIDPMARDALLEEFRDWKRRQR